jgi:hypothetical protein
MGNKIKRVEGYKESGRREKLGEEIKKKKKKKKTCRGEREKKKDKHKEWGWV